ncbi:MAG: TraR/DksA C4-type zinc finger protein [Gammaproteobacteria bacterium]|nr:TraR/DksA C4-type zinc finger protein [Gammaproteobacteria bacterium]
MKTMNQDKVRKQLLDTKTELEKRISKIHNHARNPLNADSAEQAAELGNVEVVTALETEAIEELAEIKAALHRLDDGSYGICVTCGEEIGAGRLAVRPESFECVDCADLPPI